MAKVNLEKIRRILVITLSNIGDVIVTTPVISLLRERFPHAHLSVLVGPKAKDLFLGCRTVNQVFLYEKRGSWLEKLKQVARLRQEKFDLVVDLKNTAIPFLIGAKYRTRIGLERLFRRMRDQHLARLRFLFPISFQERNEFDFFSPEDLKSASLKFEMRAHRKIPERLIIVAPGARGYLKRWPASRFGKLCSYWIEKKAAVVLVGSEDESELGGEIQRAAKNQAVNLIGRLSLRELAALVSKAALVVVNDSATLHLAVELGRPVVGIFGPTDETKCGRFDAQFRVVRTRNLECAPCLEAHCLLEQRICLDDLKSETVIAASEEILSGSSS